MKTTHTPHVLHSTLALLLAAGGLLGAASAAAQPVRTAPADGGRMVCDGVRQDRRACQREAGAAQQAARSGALTSATPERYEQNALARCGLQPPADRADCEARVRGTGNTNIDGSVLGGGLIRESVRTVPAPATVPMPAPAPLEVPAPQPMPLPGPAPLR